VYPRPAPGLGGENHVAGRVVEDPGNKTGDLRQLVDPVVLPGLVQVPVAVAVGVLLEGRPVPDRLQPPLLGEVERAVDDFGRVKDLAVLVFIEIAAVEVGRLFEFPVGSRVRRAATLRG
jgi:hypothetical protein